jgi:predicted nucleic-acid-binding protein
VPDVFIAVSHRLVVVVDIKRAQRNHREQYEKRKEDFDDHQKAASLSIPHKLEKVLDHKLSLREKADRIFKNPLSQRMKKRPTDRKRKKQNANSKQKTANKIKLTSSHLHFFFFFVFLLPLVAVLSVGYFLKR